MSTEKKLPLYLMGRNPPDLPGSPMTRRTAYTIARALAAVAALALAHYLIFA